MKWLITLVPIATGIIVATILHHFLSQPLTILSLFILIVTYIIVAATTQYLMTKKRS
jgi:hypothetical protein